MGLRTHVLGPFSGAALGYREGSGAATTFTVHSKLTVTGSCTNLGKAQQVLSVELTAAQTALLTRGRYFYKITATMPTSSHVVLLASGTVTASDVVTAPAS